MKKTSEVSFDEIFEHLSGSSILSELAGLTNKSLLDISETIKITANGSSKTIVSKKSIVSKGFGRSIKTSTINVSISSSKKNRIMEIIFTEVFQSLQKTIQAKFQICENFATDKNTLFDVIAAVDQHYENILCEIRELHETYHSYLRDVYKKDFICMDQKEFVQKIFSALPELQTYFREFKYEILTLEQINSIQNVFSIASFLFDIPKILKQKQELAGKKKNKKKKNKNKKNLSEKNTDCTESISQTISETGVNRNEAQCMEAISFISKMRVDDQRNKCFATDHWLSSLGQNFLR